MAASYPGAIKTFSAITKGSTVLEQALFDDPGLEVEAIETELGVAVHGSAGSLAERLLLAMNLDGVARGLMHNFDATNSQRKRLRCGVTAFRCIDMTAVTKGLKATLTFAPALQAACHAFCKLQLVEDDASLGTIPAFVGYVMDTGTTTTFEFRIVNGTNGAPNATTGFLLHWVAVEKDFSGTSTSY